MPTTSPTGSNRRGFTLVELTIVLFIAAVMMAVAVPSFVRSYNASLVGATSRNFSTLCQLARIQAITHQRPAFLHLDIEGQKIWISQTQGTGDVEMAEQTVKVFEMSDRVALVSAEFADGALAVSNDYRAAFYPNGTCDGLTVVFRGVDPKAGVATTLDPVTTRAISYEVKL